MKTTMPQTKPTIHKTMAYQAPLASVFDFNDMLGNSPFCDFIAILKTYACLSNR